MNPKTLLTGVAILAAATSFGQSSRFVTKPFKTPQKNKIFIAPFQQKQTAFRPTADSTYYRPIARTESYMNNGQYELNDSMKYVWHKNEGANYKAAYDETGAFDITEYLMNFIYFDFIRNDIFYKNNQFDTLKYYYYDGTDFILDDSITYTYNTQDQIISGNSSYGQMEYRYDNLGNLNYLGYFQGTTLSYYDSATYDNFGNPLTQLSKNEYNSNHYEYTYDNNGKLETFITYNKTSNDNFQSANDMSRLSYFDLGNNVDSILMESFDYVNNTYEIVNILLDYKNSANNTDSLLVYDDNSSNFSKVIHIDYSSPNHPITAKLGEINSGEFNYFRFEYNNLGKITNHFRTYVDETNSMQYDPYKEEFTYDINHNLINIKSLVAPDNDTVNWNAEDYNFNINVYYEAVTVQVEDPNSIKHLATDAVNIYPNPSTDHINITVKDAQISNIQVYDAMGRLVISKNAAKHTTESTISVNNLAVGNYIISITTDKGIGVKKFTKN